MEYPEDENAIKIDDQFLFGEELLIAPVLKKGERVKRVYLPDGEWIDFNNKKTVYLGGQTVAYQAPLSTIPIFVKKGSIVPQIPVMQYLEERTDYPVFVHVFPNYEDESASFELYEDEGNNQDYLKDIYSKTRFNCQTKNTGWETTITPEDKGYRQAERRDIVLKFHLEAKPKSVSIGGKSVKNAKQELIEKHLNSDKKTIQWSWNAETNECWVKVPDERSTLQIKIYK